MIDMIPEAITIARTFLLLLALAMLGDSVWLIYRAMAREEIAYAIAALSGFVGGMMLLIINLVTLTY